MTALGVKIKWDAVAFRNLERQVNAQVAPLGPAISQIANEGTGRPVEGLVTELSAVIREVGAEPNEQTVGVLAERISAGESIADLLD